jgi:phenylacetate-coenzyme A ligase PaaK-like adenylate-forming protein
MKINYLKNKIFKINSVESFNEIALEIFRWQWQSNPAYSAYVNHLRIRPERVKTIRQIPFLPIQFFKTQKIYTGDQTPGRFFESSGTTGEIRSRHYFVDLKLYERSFISSFQQFFGDINQYCILGLLPSYLGQQNSSLVYMVNRLIQLSGHAMSGFYLDNLNELANNLKSLEKAGQKSILIGVSYALLDLIELHKFSLKNTLIVETGGMKGRRREMIREELHSHLSEGFGVEKIWSEYGMTELFSQAWSTGNGKFITPPWMRVFIRDMNDPLSPADAHKTGGINVIDLANIHSCAFIATQDLGRINDDGSLEILGRFDNAEVRGCNVMVSN